MFLDKKGVSGYMTVEASFIVPWTVFIIAALIYLGYFEYDRCVIFQDDYTIATQTATRIMPVSKQQDWLEGHKNKLIGNKYFATTNINTEGNVSSTKVTVASSMRVKWFDIADKVMVDNYSFTERLRLQRTIGRVIGGKE